MSFETFLQSWSKKFVESGLSGEFSISVGRSLKDSVDAVRVPDKPGVYLIFGESDHGEELLYVGKGGTLRNDGTFKGQKIYGRLLNVQENQRREVFFRNQMRRGSLNSLRIRYFATFEGPVRVVPSLAEAQLLQAYFEEHGKLPSWNKEF